MYALMKVIAKFSLEEFKCIPELLPRTSRPCGWRVPRKRSANVSKPSAMHTTVHKIKLEAKGVACISFDARAEHLKQLDFNSLRQCQIQLSKVNPMIPFVNSMRMRGIFFQVTLQKLSLVNILFFHHFYSRQKYVVRTLTFITLF